MPSSIYSTAWRRLVLGADHVGNDAVALVLGDKYLLRPPAWARNCAANVDPDGAVLA